ncbi:hypothetical protein XU18_1783 [Perkinsela sp. CCAP 1560/4]|nr:hypothetical protein XU18_1783 [Perkinsela sp. CCAP 1560/4]|eukprot:KNH07562.1 hypothetical protein XU18_1783 [Perkinsela sp. CCAP 1560/4]
MKGCQNYGNHDSIGLGDILREMSEIYQNIATICVQRVARSMSIFLAVVDYLHSVRGRQVESPLIRPVKGEETVTTRNHINFQVMRIIERLHREKPLVDHSLRANVLSILSLNSQLGIGFDMLQKSAIAGSVKARDFRALVKYSSNLEVTVFLLLYAKKLGVVFTNDDFVFFLQRTSQSSRTKPFKHSVLRQIESHVERVDGAVLGLLQLTRHQFFPIIFHQRLETSATSVSPGIGLVAICPQCNGHLRRFPYSASMRDRLLDRLLNHAREKCRDTRLHAEIQAFLQVLREKQMDVVLDGANIGYCGLDRSLASENETIIPFKERPQQPHSNRDAPVKFHLWLEHIDAVVNAVRAQHLRPVIVLHRRHVERHRLWDKYRGMVDRWKRDGILLCTPNGVEDDILWLYTLLYHSHSRKRMFIVTNDLGRDHLFALGDQLDLRRFFHECQVKFKILPPGTVAIVDFPMPFAVRPQFCERTCRWHIPVKENDSARWECCALAEPMVAKDKV